MKFCQKIFCLLFLLLITSVSCTTIDMSLSKKIDISKKLKKVAVLPFEIKGVKWGDEFADAITHNFFKSGEIEVVERESIEKILKEQKLSMTGIIDPNRAARLGKLIGADVILLGNGKALRRDKKNKDVSDKNLIDTFTLKAINVETGSLLLIVRKEPGIAWNTEYRLKWCLSGSCIWDRNDILHESSTYDDISRQIVKKILTAIKQIKVKNDSKKNS